MKERKLRSYLHFRVFNHQIVLISTFYMTTIDSSKQMYNIKYFEAFVVRNELNKI